MAANSKTLLGKFAKYRYTLPVLPAKITGKPNVITISQNSGATYTGFTGVVIREANATTNFYPGGFSGLGLSAGNNGALDRSHTVINISGLSNITSGTVANAVIRFNLSNVSSGAGYSIAIRKMLVASNLTQATWSNRLTATLWGTMGCAGDGVDRAATVLASVPVVDSQTGIIELSSAALTQAIQDIVSGTSTITWFELESLTDGTVNGFANFRDDTQTDGLRPELVVTMSTNTSLNLNLSGISLGLSQGAISPTVNTTLSGIALGLTQSAISTNFSTTLASQLISSSQGSLTKDFARTLASQLISTSQANITYGYSQTLSSQLLTLSQSNLSLVFDKSLQGQALTTQQATLTYSLSTSLASQLITSATSSIGYNTAISLVGQQANLSQATLKSSFSTALASQLLNLNQGTITYSSGTSFTGTLSGIALGISQGAFSYAFDKTLTSQLVSTSQSNLGYNVSTALSGQALNLGQGNLSPALSKTLASQLITSNTGTITAAITGNVVLTLTGQSLGLSQGSLIPYVDTVSTLGGGNPLALSKQQKANREKALQARLISLGVLPDAVSVLSDVAQNAELPALKASKQAQQNLIAQQNRNLRKALKEQGLRYQQFYKEALKQELQIRQQQLMEEEEIFMMMLFSTMY